MILVYFVLRFFKLFANNINLCNPQFLFTTPAEKLLKKLHNEITFKERIFRDIS